MTDATPLDGVDLILADLDGVIYTGRHAIPHAIDSINAAAKSIAVGYITNNASRTPASVAEHLTGLGLRVAPEDVVTSPQAGVKLLAGLVPAGSTILVVGGAGLLDVVRAAGFVATDSAEDKPAAVIQGFGPEVGWKQLAEAAYALARDSDGHGIPWVATNTDWTIPQERGIAPGNGTLVSAVHTAVGILPVVAGKPEKAIFDEAVARFGGSSPVVIGDRLDTDILGANRAGIPSIMVLTGIDGAKQLIAAAPDERPHYVLEDLRGLTEPYPVIEQGEDTDGSIVTKVGDAIVRRRDTQLTIEQSGESRIDLIRAGAAAVWTSGLAIYALDVPTELYS
ncbi:MAG: glycerol-phosphatase [Actinomycetota bacterium]|jgi:HAD superfamily hydrolase (TIGR01450 family)|nr:glycerol-phosphatase [Actinomycetota bacterium]